MQFFERQEAVRRRSRWLVLGFVLAVSAVVLAVNAVAWLVFVALPGQADAALPVALGTTLLTLLLMAGASLYRIVGLRRGGAAVAQAMGGTPVPPDASDPAQRRLRNVVEEMAIAAGLPVPQVFVLEDESRINAFAAGYSPADAAVAVTRGALDRLNRAELQAVVAHEFGHIAHGDIRLNLRLLGALFGIVVLGMVGRHLLGAGRRSRDGAPLALLAVALIVVGAVGLYAARLIKAGLSRQREFLADAASVQFTRDPDALVGAFLKIAGVPGPARMAALEAEEISHMLFDEGAGLSGWMATHPPLLARIQALRPGFKPARLEDARARQSLPAPSGLDEDRALGLSAAAPLPPAPTAMLVSPAALGLALGQCQAADHARAEAVLSALPEVAERAARDREDALPLLYSLLLAHAAPVRQRQRSELLARTDERLVGQAFDFAERLADLHPALRLPLAELALASLKRRPAAEWPSIADTCFALSHADGRVCLFEYALAQSFRQQLEALADPSQAWRRPSYKLVEREADVVALLAALAQAGHDSTADAQRAFMAGLQRVLPNSAASYAPPVAGLAALDEVWPRLDALLPKGKLQLLEGLAAAAAHDGRLRVAEAELLRLVARLLNAPLPAALAATP